MQVYSESSDESSGECSGSIDLILFDVWMRNNFIDKFISVKITNLRNICKIIILHNT